MRQRLQPILDLLDEGLRIYRRGFVSFTLLSAIPIVPLIGIILLIVALTNSAYGELGLLGVFGLIIISLPLLIYAVAAMSRAALLAHDGERIELRRALSIPPLRLIGMGCYGGIFLFVANAAVSGISMVCFCPIYFALMFAVGGFFGGMSGAGGMSAALSAVLIAIAGVAFVLFYALSLVLSGATYSSLVFSIQPFMHEKLRLGDAVQRSFDLLFYRFGQNLLGFLCASLVFGALTLSVTIAIGLLLPLPLLITMGQESPFVQGISASAWLAGGIVAMPALPIWMALLYKQRLAEHTGSDLAERIMELEKSEI